MENKENIEEPEINQVKKGLRAVCALIINKDNKILSVSRKDDHDDWGLPGGKVETNESLEEALYRECLEETGYEVKIISSEIPFDYTELDESVSTRTYLCEIINQDSPHPVDENEGLVSFKDPDILLQGSFGAYNLKCFARFNSKVFYKSIDINFEG